MQLPFLRALTDERNPEVERTRRAQTASRLDKDIRPLLVNEVPDKCHESLALREPKSSSGLALIANTEEVAVDTVVLHESALLRNAQLENTLPQRFADSDDPERIRQRISNRAAEIRTLREIVHVAPHDEDDIRAARVCRHA